MFVFPKTLLTSIVSGYKHPNGHPICDLHYVCLKLSEEERMALSLGRRKPVPQSRLFISFHYDGGNVPPGSKKTKDRHLPVLCPFSKNNKPCGETGFTRHSNIKSHDCLNPIIQPTQRKITELIQHWQPKQTILQPPSQRPKKSTPNTPLQKEVQSLIIELIAGTQLSLAFASSPSFLSILQRLIIIAQQHTDIDPICIIPSITPHSLSDEMKAEAKQAVIDTISAITDEFVSVMFDGATINHQKYLAITVIQTNPHTKPIFLHIVRSPQTSDDYTAFVIELLQVLQQYNVHVTSFCTDGLSAQITGIDNARGRLLNPMGNPPTVSLPLLPFHIPCLNHRLNLVLIHAIKNSYHLSSLVRILQDFSTKASRKQRQKHLQKHCPVFIHSRWHCLSLICSYIRLKREIIVENRYLSRSKLIQILRMEIVLLPLFELQLFFERSETKLAHAYPALLRAILQYSIIIQDELFRAIDWLYAITEIVRLLHAMILDDSFGSLIKLAFSLTPHGQYLFSKMHFASGYNPHSSIMETLETLFASCTVHCYCFY